MFTGIITDIGKIVRLENREDGVLCARVSCSTPGNDLGVGDSIACSGVCMTIVESGTEGDSHWFEVHASEETRRITTLQNWKINDFINLEPALRIGAPLGGHLVSGHVDGMARVVSMEEVEGCLRIWLTCPAELSRYVATKCSIGLDGISLTVNETDEADLFRFRVEIIPHTRSATSWKSLAEGALVNMEVDMLARYVERLVTK